MKKVFKKNQFVVTLLAVLIAIAGYLNYADKLAKEDNTQEVNNTYDAVYGEDDLLASENDIVSLDEEVDVDVTGNEIAENESFDVEEEESQQPGTAVLTSGTNMSDFTIQARLNREQTRSKNKETLMEIINNTELSNEQKQTAVDAMVSLTETTELENNIETVLEAKGYEDVIVTISDGQADVLINKAQVEENDRAQIEDIVTRKTDIKLNNIVITPISEE